MIVLTCINKFYVLSCSTAWRQSELSPSSGFRLVCKSRLLQTYFPHFMPVKEPATKHSAKFSKACSHYRSTLNSTIVSYRTHFMHQNPKSRWCFPGSFDWAGFNICTNTI